MSWLFVGDSFTYGEELPDRTKSYPSLLGKMYNVEIVNDALPGASSDYVFRKTIETLIDPKNQYECVFVSWPEQSRFETVAADETFPHGIDQIRVNARDLVGNRRKRLVWIDDYYKYSYTMLWGFRRQLNQIIALEGFLQSKNQRYLMTNVAGLQGYYHEYYEYLKTQIKSVRKLNFIGWPMDGIVEWQGDCPLAEHGHPLELGHERIAKVIDEHIRNLGWFS